MKNYIAALMAILLLGCQAIKADGEIQFATCADYPPLEYYEDGELVGFDIEVAKLVGEKLHKKVVFKDMAFGVILVSLENGSVDAAIAAYGATEERRKNFDFSDTYYKSGKSIVYKKSNPVTDLAKVSKKKIACQSGCVCHEALIKAKAPSAEIVLMDNMNVAIESLKAGHVDYVFLDSIPAQIFCEKNQELACTFVAEDEEGYAIVLKKGSPLLEQVNKALEELKSEGKIEKLKQKYKLKQLPE